MQGEVLFFGDEMFFARACIHAAKEGLFPREQRGGKVGPIIFDEDPGAHRPGGDEFGVGRDAFGVGRRAEPPQQLARVRIDAVGEAVVGAEVGAAAGEGETSEGGDGA